VGSQGVGRPRAGGSRASRRRAAQRSRGVRALAAANPLEHTVANRLAILGIRGRVEDHQPRLQRRRARVRLLGRLKDRPARRRVHVHPYGRRHSHRGRARSARDWRAQRPWRAVQRLQNVGAQAQVAVRVVPARTRKQLGDRLAALKTTAGTHCWPVHERSEHGDGGSEGGWGGGEGWRGGSRRLGGLWARAAQQQNHGCGALVDERGELVRLPLLLHSLPPPAACVGRDGCVETRVLV